MTDALSIFKTFLKSQPDLKIVDINKYKRGPSHIEGKERLDALFENFVERGADPEMVAEMIFAYGVCEVINYASRPENGLDAIARLLSESFGLDIERNQYFDPEISGFVRDDD